MKFPIVLSLVLAAGASFAHDTWLLPERPHLEPGERLVLDLTSAMDFPRPETAVNPDRLLARGVRLGGKRHELAPEPGAKALRLSVELDRPGIAAAWIESHPRTLQLTPKEVEEYLKEVGLFETIGAEWKKSGSTSWDESYVKIAKSYVRVGKPADDRTWEEPLGLALEMIPGTDPTMIRAGDAFPVRLLLSGKPISGLPVGAVAAGAHASMAKTDQDGRASITLDRPGPWLLRATLIRPEEGTPGKFTSIFTTLTLHVGPGPAGRTSDRP
jgi:uncharacterized GH25 family protein